MKHLSIQQMEDLTGADKCEFLTWTLMGLGATLCTSVVAAPLGIVIGGVGAASYFTGGCGK